MGAVPGVDPTKGERGALEAARVAAEVMRKQTSRAGRVPSSLGPIASQLRLHPDPNLASEFYHRLASWIGRFEEGLDEEHEVGVRLVSFGQAVQFSLLSMSYHNPSLIGFSGRTDDGTPVELVQHVSQISVLLVAAPRADVSVPRRPIGFVDPAASR
jgi:hypothetical protein